MLSLSFAFIAGLLSVLSPCVLPLLPIVLGAAASRGRLGPLALAAGMTASFVGIGMFVALFGWGIGLDQGFFRALAAALLIAVGLVLAVPLLQARFAVAAGPVSGWIDQRFGGFEAGGTWGQFGAGALLGAVWSPCVGPTLGAASLLAAQGESLGEVTAVMAVFGLGAALPLVVLGALSRELLVRWRARVLGAGSTLKTALGGVLIISGLVILSGQDKRLENALVELSPAWLTELTTRY